MKKNYKKLTKLTNAIDPAAPASVWGYKGCAGKGGATLNATIPEWMFDREMAEMLESKGGNANA